MTRKLHASERIAANRRLRAAGSIADPKAPAAHTFLLRLWKETRDDAREEPIWRGTVSDLRGHQLGSFSSAAELAGIVGGAADTSVLLRLSWARLNAGEANTS